MGGDESGKGHEGEACLGDRQGEAREVQRVQRLEGEDRKRPEEDRPHEDQGREDCDQEVPRRGQEGLPNIKGWTTAVQKARKALGVKGFQAVKKGSPLYKKAKEL